MDEQKDKTDDSEMSRNNKSEYNSFVAAYKAAYLAMSHGQVLKETTATWQSLKDHFPMGMLCAGNVCLFYKSK